jgi:hypothetical protein
MTLYQEILFLKSWFKGRWVIENVIPYYEPLIKPTVELGRHFFWSNFEIQSKKFTNIDVSRSTQEELAKDLGVSPPSVQQQRVKRKIPAFKIGFSVLPPPATIPIIALASPHKVFLAPDGSLTLVLRPSSECPIIVA